jgi:hypothetical protein
MSTDTGEQAGSSSTSKGNVFRCEADYWTVAFSGRAVRVRDTKGMRYLGRLLAEPGREFHALDLAAAEEGDVAGNRRAAFGDAGALLDDQAKRAYRRRLAEIDDDIDEARVNGDVEREAQARTEQQFLVSELARAVGLSGRDRRAGVVSERARAAVTQAVRRSMARLASVHPELGDHLERTVRTGTYCSYLPDPRVPTSWKA